MKENIVAMYHRVENEDMRLTDPIAIAMVQRILAKQRAAALITDAQARAPKGSPIGGQWVGKAGGTPGGQGPFDVAPELINKVGSGLKARAEAIGFNQEPSGEDIGHVDRLFAERPDLILVTPSRSLDAILSEGFKPAAVTGETTRSYMPQSRAKLEKELFGKDLKNPIYGVLGGESKESKSEVRLLSRLGYGDVAVTLSDSVKDRTTLTFGDSLDVNSGYIKRDHGFPDEVVGAIRRPSIPFAASDRAAAYKAMANSEWRSDRYGVADVGLDYVEAQIWGGGVAVSDIKSVQFRSKAPSKQIEGKLASLNIPWSIKNDIRSTVKDSTTTMHADAYPNQIAKHPDGAVLLEAGVNEFGFKMAVAVMEGQRSKPMIVEAFLKFGGWELIDNFSDEQARAPKGTSIGGQWVKTGSGGGGSDAAAIESMATKKYPASYINELLAKDLSTLTSYEKVKVKIYEKGLGEIKAASGAKAALEAKIKDAAIQSLATNKYPAAYVEALLAKDMSTLTSYEKVKVKIYKKGLEEHKLTLAAPAPAPAPVVTAVPKLSKDFTLIGSKPGGSNPGGLYNDKNGEKWLVKGNKQLVEGKVTPQTSEERANNEVLASKLMLAAGAGAPEMKTVDLGTKHGGGLGVASKWVDGVVPFDVSNPAHIAAAQKDFAVQAWLGNYDTLGQGYDNTVIINGKAVNIDPGGAVLFRAQGMKKASFPDHAPEFESMRLNTYEQKAVFGTMTSSELSASASKLSKITDVQIATLVDTHGPGNTFEKTKLTATLIARRDVILIKAHLAVKAQAVTAKAAVKPKLSEFAGWQSNYISNSDRLASLNGTPPPISKGNLPQSYIVPLSNVGPKEKFIRSYTGGAYKIINKNLRNGGTPTYDDTQRDIAIAMHAAPSRVVVVRGISSAAAKTLFAGSQGFAKGAILRDAGYASTTRAVEIATSFGGTNGYVMKINISKGQYVMPVKHMSKNPHEDEFLLPRESQFKIMAFDPKNQIISVDLL